MGVESGKPKYPTLKEFDAMWRGSGRNFYAIICESLGSDEAAYSELTEEIIAEAKKNSPTRDPKEIEQETIKDILRSFDRIITDPVLQEDEEKMAKAHEGMAIWLNLLKGMQN